MTLYFLISRLAKSFFGICKLKICMLQTSFSNKLLKSSFILQLFYSKLTATWINASWKWPRGSLAMVERLTFSLWEGRRYKCPHDARPDQMRSDTKPCIPSQFISKHLNLINTSRWGWRTFSWTWEEILICQWHIHYSVLTLWTVTTSPLTAENNHRVLPRLESDDRL